MPCHDAVEIAGRFILFPMQKETGAYSEQQKADGPYPATIALFFRRDLKK